MHGLHGRVDETDVVAAPDDEGPHIKDTDAGPTAAGEGRHPHVPGRTRLLPLRVASSAGRGAGDIAQVLVNELHGGRSLSEAAATRLMER
jgi:hypothetical protein